MIYRPVRERDPDAIVKAVVEGVQNGGYDETSLTALSTADVSCITPLVKRVMSELKKKQVTLSVSSLRAYGLNEELLDEMSQVRATGLTFAPEAGTQRMRDVINKNVTEEDITASAEKIFSRGWSRMKCYFMIGLPTETDEDVLGIAQTGGRLRRMGRRIRKDADVTVSVSSHVPKPHTPFQWCAMDSMDELKRKQRLLRDVSKGERIDLKWHDAGISHVEGILSRGDRRLGDVIEAAWKNGARFDGWDEKFDLGRWERALDACGVDRNLYLQTRPVDARLPWDHLDIGLEDGFLAWEYRRALKDRVSPPCGKPNKTLLHHTNIEDALADQRKLVCFDCGIACDMTQMREERIVYLRKLDARKDKPNPTPSARRVPSPDGEPLGRREMPQPVGFTQEPGTRFRLRFQKVGRGAFISHLDTMRLLIRVFRRAGIEMIYSKGYHPKPQVQFAPALGLGIAALSELCDVRVIFEGSGPELAALLGAAAPTGLVIAAAVRMGEIEPGLSKVLGFADYAAWVPGVVEAQALRSGPGLTVERMQKGVKKIVDVSKHLVSVDVPAAVECEALCERLEWPAGGTVLSWRLHAGGDGSAKPTEVVQALLGEPAPEATRYARVALWATVAGRSVDALDLPALVS